MGFYASADMKVWKGVREENQESIRKIKNKGQLNFGNILVKGTVHQIFKI